MEYKTLFYQSAEWHNLDIHTLLNVIQSLILLDKAFR